MLRVINMKKGIHCIISGRVQGVFYRANTQRKAVEIGVKGWVRNLADGRVEVMAFGDDNQLQLLTQWLRQGPPTAQVDDVVIEELEFQEMPNFSVR